MADNDYRNQISQAQEGLQRIILSMDAELTLLREERKALAQCLVNLHQAYSICPICHADNGHLDDCEWLNLIKPKEENNGQNFLG
jgi:hypothetical protein